MTLFVSNLSPAPFGVILGSENGDRKWTSKWAPTSTPKVTPEVIKNGPSIDYNDKRSPKGAPRRSKTIRNDFCRCPKCMDRAPSKSACPVLLAAPCSSSLLPAPPSVRLAPPRSSSLLLAPPRTSSLLLAPLRSSSLLFAPPRYSLLS